MTPAEIPARRFLGADILAYLEAWPLGDDWYHDEGDDGIADLGSVDPAAWYDGAALGFAVCYEPDAGDDGCVDIADLIEEWQRARDGARCVVWVPHDRRGAFAALLAQCGLTLEGT